MQKLIISLQSDDLSDASWVITAADGSLIQPATGSTADQLRADAREKQIIVIPPLQDVLLTVVTLPKLSRYRLLQALPYALEEQLLADVGALHFAVGEYQADGTLPVAVVAKQKIQHWLATLQANEIYPTLLLPPVLSVPYLSNNWNMIISKTAVVARTDRFSGFTCDPDNLTSLLECELAERAHKPQTIYCHNYTDSSLAIALPAVNIVEQRHSSTTVLEDTAKQLHAPFINLCQGPYQTKHKPSENKCYWRFTAIVLAAWLGLLLACNLITYTVLHHQSTRLETQIATIYKQYFPNATAVVEPKTRMTQKMNALLNQGNKNNLLLWLAYLGKSLPQANGIRLQQLDFRNNILSIDVLAKNFGSIDQLTKALQTQGISVKQQNVAATGNAVKGTLIMTESPT